MPFRRTSIDSNQRTGFYSPKRSRVVGSRFVGYDSDALVYINAVEAADGQALEFNVKVAYNNFVLGCKSDGIWNAIKASCILAGARTLSGALVPLVGAAPTNNNFVAGDYDRKTGLLGNGSTKYLNSNRANNSDPQNSKHFAVYATTALTSTASTYPAYGGAQNASNPFDGVYINRDASNGQLYSRLNSGSFGFIGAGAATGFIAINRASAASWSSRVASTNTSYSQSSTSNRAETLFIYANNGSGSAIHYGNGRLAFYSIGESLDLALLDTRVSGLLVAISGAIS